MAFQRGPHVKEIFVLNSKKVKNKNTKNAANKPVKMGEYRPRILSGDDVGNIPIPRIDNDHQFSSTIITDIKPKPYIVGDKDTPIVLHPISHDDEDFLIPPTPKRQQSTKETDNPVFNNRDAVEFEQTTEIINGVVIPPPDYLEEDLYAEIVEKVDFNRPVHRNYGGEDFSNFLADDDGPINNGGLTWRSEKPVSRNYLPIYDKRAKTEAKRGNRYQKRETKSKSIFSSSKSKTSSSSNKRNSLRDFSFADTKSVDKTIRSQSLTRQISSSSRGSEEADTFLNAEDNSYEGFLQARHPDNSGYSGYNGSGGIESTSPNSQKVNSFWKRLTWRHKKPDKHSYYMAYE